MSVPARYRDPHERLWPRLRPDGFRPGVAGECMVWSGSRNEHGYGSLRVDRRLVKAHRFAFELIHGPIPDGADVLHHCDNPPCCNPEHLFLGDARTNAIDMVAKGRHGAHRKPERWARGERHHRARLTASQVADIRRRAGESVSALAREFGVARATIRAARDGKTWRTA